MIIYSFLGDDAPILSLFICFIFEMECMFFMWNIYIFWLNRIIISFFNFLYFLLKYGWTPLCYACIEGHVGVVKALLKGNVNVNAPTTQDRKFYWKVSFYFLLIIFVYCVDFVHPLSPPLEISSKIHTSSHSLSTWANRGHQTSDVTRQSNNWCTKWGFLFYFVWQ